MKSWDDDPPVSAMDFAHGIPPEDYLRPAQTTKITGVHPMDWTATELLRKSVAGDSYTSADFDRNNDPYYFDKISRASRCNTCSQKYLINKSLTKK